MNWNEIEAKWAAMARRVRSDLPRVETKAITAAVPPKLQPDPSEMRAPPTLDRTDA